MFILFFIAIFALNFKNYPNKMIKNIFTLIVLSTVLSLGFTSCKSKQKITEIPAANIPAGTVTKSDKQTPSTATTTKTVVNQKEETISESFKLASGETNTTAMSKKYHVVVGSFKVQENALNLRSKLINGGNNALTVENESGMLRVIIASFNDYNEAHQKRDEIKDAYPGAWVLVQK